MFEFIVYSVTKMLKSVIGTLLLSYPGPVGAKIQWKLEETGLQAERNLEILSDSFLHFGRIRYCQYIYQISRELWTNLFLGDIDYIDIDLFCWWVSAVIM
jgi:hypothetical protein